MRRELLAWYREKQRDLPWRRTRDPYRIWLSETMLQQTRVETVVPYYERFVARFPDVESLAVADEQDVLREWAGLGYYARARNLKRAAERVLSEHGGQLPRDPDALAALPGVGRYTVGALRSIAFGERAAIVDGNVKRVLARLLAQPALAEHELWALAGELVPSGRPDQFNQGLMELGATVCMPRAPGCAACPLAHSCAAAAEGRPEAYPARSPRKPAREVEALAGVLQRGSQLLMVRRPSRGLLGGLWELPSSEGADPTLLEDALAVQTGLCVRTLGECGSLRHVFTHRALTLRIVSLEKTGGRLRPGLGSDVRWCSRVERRSLPLSTLMKKALRIAEADA